MIGIGSTVWIFDLNRRVYPKRKPGESYSSGGPIFRKHFVPFKVTSDTSKSWVLEGGRKVRKADLRTRSESPNVFTSERQIEEACFVNDNRHVIARAVDQCRDASVLKQIAELLKVRS